MQSGILQLDGPTLEGLLAACKDLPDGSEGELRASNATRAELVGGLLRAALLSKDKGSVQRLSGFLEEMVEKASLEHSADYIEALAYAATAPYSPAAQPLFDMCQAAFRATLQAQEQDFKKQGTETVAAENEEGFSRHSKRLKLMMGLLYGALEGSAQSAELVAQVRADLVGAGSAVISGYRTSRTVMSSIICSQLLAGTAAEAPVLTKSLLDVCVSEEERAKISKAAAEGGSMDLDGESKGNDEEKEKDNRWKNALDTAHSVASLVVQTVYSSAHANAVLPGLLSVLLSGSGHSDLETAKRCHLGCLLISQSVLVLDRDAPGNAEVLGRYIDIIAAQADHSSWHVRETVMMCLCAFMLNNWAVLSADEKKRCKDVFASGKRVICDIKEHAFSLGWVVG